MRRLIATAVLLLALVMPGGAAASPQALIRDCLANGKITGHYSQQDYTQALADLPSNISEYTDCADVIRAAELAAAAGLPTPGSGINPRANPLASLPPAERAAVLAARKAGSTPLSVGGVVLQPGAVNDTAFKRLPAPLWAALAALVATALALGAVRSRKLVRSRRPR